MAYLNFLTHENPKTTTCNAHSSAPDWFPIPALGIGAKQNVSCKCSAAYNVTRQREAHRTSPVYVSAYIYTFINNADVRRGPWLSRTAGEKEKEARRGDASPKTSLHIRLRNSMIRPRPPSSEKTNAVQSAYTVHLETSFPLVEMPRFSFFICLIPFVCVCARAPAGSRRSPCCHYASVRLVRNEVVRNGVTCTGLFPVHLSAALSRRALLKHSEANRSSTFEGAVEANRGSNRRRCFVANFSRVTRFC